MTRGEKQKPVQGLPGMQSAIPTCHLNKSLACKSISKSAALGRCLVDCSMVLN